jgi:hypothetical protein
MTNTLTAHYKPRIRKITPPPFAALPHPAWQWMCRIPGSCICGYGATPKSAYQSWRGRQYAAANRNEGQS